MNLRSSAVLLLVADRPSEELLREALLPFAGLGRPVRVAGLVESAKLPGDLPEALASVIQEVYGPSLVAEGQGPAFRRALHAAADRTERLWVHVSRDERVLARVRAGDEIRGLDAGGRAVADRLASPTSSPPRWRLALRRWRGGGLARLLADASAERALKAVDHERLDSAQLDRAGRLIDRAVSRVTSPRRRADLLGDVTARELARGRRPTRLAATATAELVVADAHLTAGRTSQAAESVSEALSVLFHRAVQFDRLDTPLAADPVGFTAPLRSSLTARKLAAPRGRDRRPRPDRAGALRVLLATHGNTNFIAGVRDRLLALDPPAEVRAIDLSGDKRMRSLLADRPGLIAAAITGAGSFESVATPLRPELDWADVVFADWCTAFGVLVTAIDPRSTRVIVRLHSFEAFSAWPHLMDFSRVDDVVFVSEHLRDLAVEAIPGLAAATTRRHVLPIGVDTDRFAGAKDADARFTVGLVGYGQIAKDPLWAFAVLRRLRKRDSRYRLVLIGSELTVQGSAAARNYLARYRAELTELESDGAVYRQGVTRDVPAALRSVGVIISSSVRESYHLGLIEGAASGAVPVVRDWPLFATRSTGARSLYPGDWVVADTDEAAERILTVTHSEQEWREHGAAAMTVVRQRFDSAVINPLLDRLFLGSSPPNG